MFCRVAGKLSVSYIKRMIRRAPMERKIQIEGAENAD
jgi:hypothetical protein